MNDFVKKRTSTKNELHNYSAHCRERGKKRKFNVHQSRVLFVEGAQQVLKWQTASRSTWEKY